MKLAIDLGWKVPVGFLVSSLEYGPCVIGTWNWFSLSGNGMALIFCLSRVSEVRLGVEGTLDLGPWVGWTWNWIGMSGNGLDFDFSAFRGY